MNDAMLAEAVRVLAGQDEDHASERNDVGFNKADSWFGHNLARLGADEWTDEIAWQVYDMLRKYTGQLSGYGIAYDALPVPPQPASAGWGERSKRELLEPLLPEYKEVVARRQRDAERKLAENARRLFIDAGTKYPGEVFVVVLGKNRPAALMNAVRALPERQWGNMRSDYGWEVRMTTPNAVGLMAILDEWGHEIGDELLANGSFTVDTDTMENLLQLAKQGATREVNPRQLVLKDGDLLFSWPKGDPDFTSLLTAVKALPKRRYEPSEYAWHVPAGDPAVVAQALRLAQINHFAIDKQLEDQADEIERQANDIRARASQEARARSTREQANLMLQTAKDAEVDLSGIDRQPFGGYQRAGIRYVVDNLQPGKGVIIGDDMGLGKTYESICAMHIKGAYPVLVVTTASVKYGFEQEWNITIPGKRTLVVNGKGLEPGYDVIVINYDVLGKHLDALKAYGFRGMIVDELHKCKSRKAQRTKNVRELAKVIPYVVGLTGTATENRAAELEQPLTITNRLDELGGWRHFMYDVCGAFHNGFGMQFPDPRKLRGVARDEYLNTIKDFNRTMRAAGCYIRRETDDVIDIPAMEHRIVPVGIDNWDEYDRAVDDIISYAGELAEKDKEFLRSIAGLPEDEQKRLKKDRRVEAEFKAERAEVLVRINKLRQLTVKGKTQAIKDYVESFVEVGRKVVVMCWHKEVAAELAKTFKCPAIVGGVDAETKFRFVQEFQQSDDCMVIVCNIVAASEGITLTAAADVIFAEQGWNPSKMDQAARRIRRIGQTRPTAQHHIVGRGTIDESLVRLIRGKRLVTSASNTGEVSEDEVTSGDLNYILKSLMGDDMNESEAA